MPKEFDVSKDTLRQIAQSLLEGKKMGRSLDNLADSFVPFADENTKLILVEVSRCGIKAAELCTTLYHSIAKEAMAE